MLNLRCAVLCVCMAVLGVSEDSSGVSIGDSTPGPAITTKENAPATNCNVCEEKLVDGNCKSCAKKAKKTPATNCNVCDEKLVDGNCKSCATKTKQTPATNCNVCDEKLVDGNCKSCAKKAKETPATNCNVCDEKLVNGTCQSCDTKAKASEPALCNTCDEVLVDGSCASCNSKNAEKPKAASDGHSCQTNTKEGSKKCSGKSCHHCTCEGCTCPHRKRLRERAAGAGEQPSSMLGSSDFFNFAMPNFHAKMVDMLKRNPQFLEYLPVSIRDTVHKGLRGEIDPSKNSFVNSAKEKYADLKDFFGDFSGVSSFISETIGNHTARLFEPEQATFGPALSAKLCAKERLTPILFIPGLLGSALEERRMNATSLPAECYTSSGSENEWARSWVSVASFLGFRCWNEVLKLSIVDEPSWHAPSTAARTKDVLHKRRFFESVKHAFSSIFASVRDLFAPSMSTETLKSENIASMGVEESDCACTNHGAHPDFSHSLLKSKFPPGIQVRPLGDGIDATSCLDSSNAWTCQTTSYFQNLLGHLTRTVVPVQQMFESELEAGESGPVRSPDTFEKCPQYVLRENIDVCPFDFRLGGYELYHAMYPNAGSADGKYGGFFEKVKAHVEKLYASNGNERVAMVSHSLGGPLTLAFLNTYVSAEWREKYVKKVITIAAPFAGAIKALQASLLGETESYLIPTWSTQSLLSSWPGIYMVFPTTPAKGEITTEKPETLVEINADVHAALHEQSETPAWYETAIGAIRDVFIANTSNAEQQHAKETTEKAPQKGATFNADELAHLLRMHPNIPNIYAAHLERLRPLFDNFRQPPAGVDIDCIYSTGIPTTKKLIFKTLDTEDIFTPEMEVDEEGDGTVRLDSLGLPRSWGTDADIDVDMAGDEPVDLYEALVSAHRPRPHDPRRPIRRTVQLGGINHVDIVVNAPEVWDFILQSVNEL